MIMLAHRYSFRYCVALLRQTLPHSGPSFAAHSAAPSLRRAAALVIAAASAVECRRGLPDRAVMAAYGFPTKRTESECVPALFERYRAPSSRHIRTRALVLQR